MHSNINCHNFTGLQRKKAVETLRNFISNFRKRFFALPHIPYRALIILCNICFYVRTYVCQQNARSIENICGAASTPIRMQEACGIVVL